VRGVFVEKYDPTIEDSYTKTIKIDDHTFSLEIMDTAGTELFNAVRELYMKKGEGFVLVYSITANSTFLELNQIHDEITEAQNLKGQGPPPIILVGNKSDLEEQREVSQNDGKELAKKFKCSWIESSAKYRTNVDKIFIDLVREITKDNKSVRTSKTKRRICNLL